MSHALFVIRTSLARKISKTKPILIGLAFALAFMIPHRTLAAGPGPIDLGSCAHFAILATATTTTTGGGVINGDVGLSPVGSQGISPGQINGTIYNGGPIAAQAQLNLSLANWTLITTNTPATNLWTFTDTNATPAVIRRFYRAFLTMP